ncbi:hypothetical protein ACJMK2_039961 [Sinanodonta woodiana]|uniref:Uncharacterized protein n=1 Tax=Sinanodonta woodiana TaxID=1069815 RepID=A0ABD3WHL2_SINWO
MTIVSSSLTQNHRTIRCCHVLSSSQGILEVRKGVGIMERQIMFAQYILVVLMTLHQTYACICAGGTLRWESIMCPNRDKTVVEGTVIRGQLTETLRNRNAYDDLALCGGYTMELEKIFKNGSNPLGLHDGTFFVVLPNSENDCGRPLNIGSTYIISGIVGVDGVFYSNTCQYIAFSTDVSVCSPEMDALMGRKELNCGSY